MVELKLKEFQKRILADESDKIIVNMSRRAGRTFLCLFKMIKEQPKTCFYIHGSMPSSLARKNVEKLLKQFNNFKNELGINNNLGIYKINYDIQNYIQIIYINSQETKLYFNNCDNIRNTYDLILMDNMLLQTDIVKGDKYFSTININGHIGYILGRKDISIYEVGLKELYENNFYTKDVLKNNFKFLNKIQFNNEIDLLCEYDELFKKDVNNKVTYENLINKFLDELDSANTIKDTTMYRKDLANIIETLEKCNNLRK